MNDSKREKILAAAHRVFLRFGYRRTTMKDLADAVEMSRPALYLLYANKEEIFRAVICRYFNQASQLSETSWQKQEGLTNQLAAVMQIWVVDPYIEISASPEARDIYEAGFTFAVDLKEEFTQRYASQLEEVLNQSRQIKAKWRPRQGLAIQQIAELMARSTLGLKREVRELDQLLVLLDTTRQIHVAALI